ncbi:SOUL family heme-binding protein [Mycobacterium asiaticum]|uniref:Heme-binding protein n=1 Tax=Mycobacterium asiaticum TaxID=1790 RepID=A0A1A3N1Q9_MYCAS|nr:heme-binding protein [Mycobacterium asiaticum]OBK15726.1 heme-binding protein [Mycobacterium asiaticum]
MLAKLVSSIGSVVEAAGTVVGYRGGTEEPDYRAESLTQDVEIRHYAARLAAETTVVAGERSAREIGFRRLARYIFGANQNQQKIAMTAPVAQQSQRGAKIAMTSPVAQQESAAGSWVIRFFMPSDKTIDSLPEPEDSAIRMVTVPPQTVAVRRFAGSADSNDVAEQTAKLVETLEHFGFEMLDTPQTWFFDPPWTLPPLRRNEIAVPVRSDTRGS